MLRNRRTRFDLIIIGIALLLVTMLSATYDWYDKLAYFFATYEHLEIDELTIVFFTAAIGLLFFSYRRLQDLKRAQTELAANNERLDEVIKERTKDLQDSVNRLKQIMAERERAQELIKKTEQRYLDMFMNMTQGVGLVNEDEVVQFCNPAYAHIFEVDSADQLIGTSLSKYLTPEGFEQAKAKTEDRRRGDISSYEIDIITAKGNRKPLLICAVPKYDEHDRFMGTFGTITDLTELKRIQELSQRAERLDEAGRVAGQIAHDFNNLLSPIVAYPELIRRKLAADHPIMQYIEAIEYSAKQISDINQDLLTLGRRGHYNTKPLNLNTVGQQIIDQFRHSHKQIEFFGAFDPELKHIKGGQSQISRTIVNLVSNAIDAMPTGGSIFIRTMNAHLNGYSGSFGKIPSGEYVSITVADTGMGIPPEVLPKIMDPFFSTKKANDKSGSGLGLSVVYSVIKDHNGFIDVQSAPGEGTQFHLYFPPATEVEIENHTRPVINGTERVLVVDDDAIQREVMTTLLRSIGYKVSQAGSSEEALAFMQKNDVDLILMDTILPGEANGAATLLQIRMHRPGQKAIMLSGTVQEIPPTESARLGTMKFLRKPVDLSTLSLAVREVLDTAAPGVKSSMSVI